MSLSKKDPSLRVAANDPHLVSLGGGRLSTAVTIHNLPVGDCTIGSSLQCSVYLCGSGVKPMHCTIYRSEENQITLVPERDARVLIDGEVIENEIDLRQGAMITIGDSYYLRYNNPAEALRMRTAIGGSFFETDSALDLDCFHEINIKSASISRQSNKSVHSVYDNLHNTQNSTDLMEWQCPKVFTADSVTVNMPAKVVLGQKYENFTKNLTKSHRKDNNITVLSTIQYNNLTLGNNSHNLHKINNTSTSRKCNESQLFAVETYSSEMDPLEDMLKICSEYTERQDRSFCSGSSGSNSSPIVQNRIKTNGSLPRENKSPFSQELQCGYQCSNSNLNETLQCFQTSKGYENVHKLKQNDIETSGLAKLSGYENVKLVQQSPRTKIRTNCMSPKKESSINNCILGQEKPQTNYEDLIKSFEEKFKKEIDTINESSGSLFTKKNFLSDCSTSIIKRRTDKNINNLTIDIKSFVSPYNSPQLLKKPTAEPRKLYKTKILDAGDLSPPIVKQLHKEREDLLERIQYLKSEFNSLQAQDNKALIEIDMKNAIILGELKSLRNNERKLQQQLKSLHQKIYRLEAQRNATRVMEENQQSKLKHSIEMKQDQIKKLKVLLQQKPDDSCLKEELLSVRESLENDKKSFEDLEFQYLEGESEWQAFKEDLNSEEQTINKQIEQCRLSVSKLELHEIKSTQLIDSKQLRLSNHLFSLIQNLHQCEEQFKYLEKKISLEKNSSLSLSDSEEKNVSALGSYGQITQSLFGSTEKLCPKHNAESTMSKSINENMFFNNKIEVPGNSINSRILKKSRDNVEANYKLYNTIKEIEKQRQLLAASNNRRDLDYKRRAIEELLIKLKTEAKHYQKQCSKHDNTESPTQNSPTPLSVTGSEHSNKMSPNAIYNSINELSMSSPDSSTSFNIDNKKSSSIPSNDEFSQGDWCRKTQKQKTQRPLTRYLPIFSKDLNLKCHIEAAGHPISLCPHIFLDDHSCRGYLHKLGSTFHAWSKRWFVLDRQRCALIYFADKSERKPRGGAYFSSIDEVYMDHLNTSKSSRPHTTFIVKTKKRSYYLQAASDTAARIWIDAIITGAQGNIDY